MEQLVATAALVAGIGSATWSYIICGLLGAAVGFVELIARYRDAPMAAVKCPSAMVYILVNAGAAVLALYLLRIFGGDLFASEDESKRWISEILVAGLGSMTFMRSSIFNVSIGTDERVPVGPAVLLDVILTTADRGVDRRRAMHRANFISGLMNGISYEKADKILPRYCFALMQNVGEKEKQVINEALTKLRASLDMSKDRDLARNSPHRSHILGLSLLQMVGPDVLAGAVGGLKKHITVTEIEIVDEPSDAQRSSEKKEDVVAENRIARMQAATGKGNGAAKPKSDRSGTTHNDGGGDRQTSDEAAAIAGQTVHDGDKSSNAEGASSDAKPG